MKINQKFISLQQGSPEWLSMRKSKITATDAAIILEKSPYCTPYILWKRKLGLIEEQPINTAMKIGMDLESIARDSFVRQVGINVIPKVAIKPSVEYMMASLDGVSECGTLAVEIKCSNSILNKANEGIIDDHYIAQLQHQMDVLGLDRMMFFAFWDNQSKIIEVKRDQPYIDILLEKEEVFFNLIRNFEPPKQSKSDLKTIDDSEFDEIASKWIATKEQINILDNQEKVLRDSLIKKTNGEDVQGCGVIIRKVVRRGAVDCKKIGLELGIDLDQYRGTAIEYWKIEGVLN